MQEGWSRDSLSLEVEFDISKARFSFSKCYAHEVVPCDELSAGGKLKIMVYLWRRWLVLM